MYRKLAPLAVLAALAAFQPAAADEIEDSLKNALEAYQAGDIKGAQEEVGYAAQLIAQMKAAELKDLLPAALDGWTRKESDKGSSAAFGGGASATARYTRGQDRIEIQLMADNQAVTAMAAMFSNPTLMGQLGQVKRINRQMVVLTKRGELQTLVDNRIFVQIRGNAPDEDKIAYFKAIDLRKLKDF